ncbi:MAG: hypothetical protein ACWA5P_13395 [bacterium]
MKKFATFIGAFMLLLAPSLATAASAENTTLTRSWRGYGNSFIFVEQGVEFSVFPDGQFDFNLNRFTSNFGVNANVGGVNVSFNTGYGYDAYVQYDDFGAVIQIENVPIYYDYYGRIIQAGNVFINYNNRGFVNRVGGLNIFYDRYNVFTHYTGFINLWNRRYVFRPWHSYYVIPRANFCILYNRPYRQWYTPIRHTYYRPYRNNVRPAISYNAGRRNSRVAQNTARRSDRYVQSRNGRRDGVATTGRRDATRNSVARTDRNRVNRTDGVTRGRPTATTTSRSGDRVAKRDKGQVNRGRPAVSTTTRTKTKRVTQTTRPTTNRSSRVSSNNSRKTSSVAQRSARSKKNTVSRSSSSKKRAVTQRSSSRSSSKSTRSSNSRRRSQ